MYDRASDSRHSLIILKMCPTKARTTLDRAPQRCDTRLVSFAPPLPRPRMYSQVVRFFLGSTKSSATLRGFARKRCCALNCNSTVGGCLANGLETEVVAAQLLNVLGGCISDVEFSERINTQFEWNGLGVWLYGSAEIYVFSARYCFAQLHI